MAAECLETRPAEGLGGWAPSIAHTVTLDLKNGSSVTFLKMALENLPGHSG